jgi:hypothetical protein
MGNKHTSGKSYQPNEVPEMTVSKLQIPRKVAQTAEHMMNSHQDLKTKVFSFKYRDESVSFRKVHAGNCANSRDEQHALFNCCGLASESTSGLSYNEVVEMSKRQEVKQKGASSKYHALSRRLDVLGCITGEEDSTADKTLWCNVPLRSTYRSWIHHKQAIQSAPSHLSLSLEAMWKPCKHGTLRRCRTNGLQYGR